MHWDLRQNVIRALIIVIRLRQRLGDCKCSNLCKFYQTALSTDRLSKVSRPRPSTLGLLFVFQYLLIEICLNSVCSKCPARRNPSWKVVKVLQMPRSKRERERQVKVFRTKIQLFSTYFLNK